MFGVEVHPHQRIEPAAGAMELSEGLLAFYNGNTAPEWMFGMCAQPAHKVQGFVG